MLANAMNYDLHIPYTYSYKDADDFFINFGFFQPLLTVSLEDSSAILLENNHAMFGVPDWLSVHSEEERCFLALLELKTARLELI